MDYVSKKWTLLILLEIYKGEKEKKRYSEIKRNMEDITPKVLSSRLKELEKQGMIKKKIDASDFPVKTEYSLTEIGKDFIPIISQIKAWALKWKTHQGLCENIDCKNCTL
jgi:DNA-binding HxlR family transcriptional regulator